MVPGVARKETLPGKGSEPSAAAENDYASTKQPFANFVLG